MSPSLPAVVVFDIGGVLSAPEGGVPELAASLGLAPEVFAGPYWAHRDAYDRGSSAAAYWGAVDADLGLGLTDERLQALDELDARRWGALAPGTPQLLERVHRAGVPLGILSNAPASLAGVVRAAAWSDPVEHLVFSCDLRAAKPEARAYEAVEEAFGRRGADLVFLDDRPVNVAAAAARGWRAHLWAGVEDAHRHLDDLGLPPRADVPTR